MKTKQLTEIERQERNGQFVANNVYYCQSILVDGLLQEGVFNFEDIENFYIPYEQAKIDGLIDEDVKEEEYDPEAQEIYEWWLVSDWMLRKLRKLGEPILSNDYGDWWGRCCTGQAIKLDIVIDRIIEG